MDVASLISTGSSETLGTSTAQPNENAKKVKHIDLAVMIRNGTKQLFSSFLCSLQSYQWSLLISSSSEKKAQSAESYAFHISNDCQLHSIEHSNISFIFSTAAHTDLEGHNSKYDKRREYNVFN